MFDLEINVIATGSTGNCYRVSDGTTAILIECGIKYADIIRGLNYKITEIETVLVSHHHNDHALCAAELAKCGFDLIMPSETAYNLCLNNAPNVYTPAAGKQCLVGTLAVVPFELTHFNSDGTDCPCYGYLIGSITTGEKLLFATDTAYIKNRFKGLTHAMIEVNYMESIIDEENIEEVERRRIKSHMSLETAIEFLKSADGAKLKELYAIHTSKTRCDKEAVRKALIPYAERVIVP